jgi:hypothetical protein
MEKRVKLYKDGETMEVWSGKVERLAEVGWSEEKPKAKAKKTPKTEVATKPNEA